MRICFTRGRGKPDTLTCVRDDGSRTWSSLNYTVHDFGHYAIETTLGWRDAFFGLLAQGWGIADFAQEDPTTGRRPEVPAQAMQAEVIAGLIDMERASGQLPAHAAFTEMLASACAGVGVAVPDVAAEQLTAIRACQADLLHRWRSVPLGESLELSF